MILITSSGCYLKELIESGGLKYHLKNNCAYVYELSEAGKTKETIIFPNKIDGYNICIGYRIGIMTSIRLQCELLL